MNQMVASSAPISSTGPRTIATPDGGVIVEFGGSSAGPAPAGPTEHFANLRDEMTDTQLYELADRLIEQVHWDLDDRDQWERMVEKAIELLGLDPNDDISADDDGMNVQVKHTLLLHALTRFSAESRTETMTAEGPADAVRARHDVPMREARESMRRLRDWSNWCFRERMRGWSAQHETTLKLTGLAGHGIKKVTRVYGTDVTCPARHEHVALGDLIISPESTSLHDGRVTHRMHLLGSDLLQDMNNGIYAVVPVRGYEGAEHVGGIQSAVETAVGVASDGMSRFSAIDPDETHTVYEVHADLRLDVDPHPDGMTRPYVVSIHVASRQILAVRRNWKPGDREERRCRAFVGYRYLSGLKPAIPMGLGQLLANPVKSLETLQSEGVTAARLANHPVGVVMSAWGAAMRDRNMKLQPGEWAVLDMPAGGTGGKMFELFPFKGADPTLLAMMERLEEQNADLAGVSTMNIAEAAGNNVPVGTILAAYDASTVIPRAVHANLHDAMAEELELQQEHARDAFRGRNAPIEYAPGRLLYPEDLGIARLVPAMKAGSMNRTRRVMEAQAIEEISERFPELHDRRRVVERIYSSYGVEDYKEVLRDEEDEAPVTADPITEFRAFMDGMPVAAAWQQNHDAHIKAHVASLRMLGGQVGEQVGPLAERAVPLVQAHIAEHVGQKLIVGFAQATGIPVQALAQGLPPEIEMRIAPAVATVMEGMAASMEGGEASLAERLAMIDAQTKLAVERMQTEREMEQTRLRERGDTERNDADNKAAVYIAAMKEGARGVPATGKDPGRGAPTQNLSPRG